MSDEQKAKSSPDTLDISQVPDEDHEQLAQAITKFYKGDTTAKSRLSYSWERNHMMLDGQQWIVYEGSRDTGGVWKPVQVNSENEFIPRPVTNYMFDAFQTLKAYILKTKPRTTVKPNTQTNRDKTAAKLATMVLEANYERLKDSYNYEFAASCLVTYGTVFKKDFWDTTPVSVAKIPKMQLVPKTDPISGAVIGEEEQPVLDEYGSPVYDELPIGDVNTCILEPYRITLDPMASDLHNCMWVMESSVQSLDWIRTTYGKEAPGFTGKVMDVKEEPQLSNSLRRWWQLKTSPGTKDTFSPGAATGSSGAQSLPNSAVVLEYYERPSEKHPKGRMVVVANNICLYSAESPYAGPDLGDWHPYSECRWELVPGRFWGKSPLDAGAELQKKINSIDAVITLTRKTMAIPQKLIPIGIGITPGMWTGQPGQNVFYRDTGNGLKPETVPASGVHESVFVERKQTLEDFKQITGAIDILKGDRPAGVTAASALNMLYEVGTGKLFPILDRWKMFVESSQKKQLKLVGQRYREPRPDFIALLKSRNNELSEQEINNFIGSDLYDNFNVTIEAGSNVPKLQSAQQALLLEIAQTGALQLEQPANRTEFLERLGIPGFDTDVGPDIKRAQWENDVMDNIVNDPENTPVVLEADVHDIHIKIHEDFEKTPAFLSKDPRVQQLVLQHVSEHKMMKQQVLQQAAMEAAMMGQAPQPQPTGMEPQNLQASGKGIPQGVKETMLEDVTAGRVGK